MYRGLHHRLKNFNSHAHVERDGKTYAVCEQEINFNSHAHVERDGVFAIFVKFFTNFNSHAHVERDRIKNKS